MTRSPSARFFYKRKLKGNNSGSHLDHSCQLLASDENFTPWVGNPLSTATGQTLRNKDFYKSSALIYIKKNMKNETKNLISAKLSKKYAPGLSNEASRTYKCARTDVLLSSLVTGAERFHQIDFPHRSEVSS